jgi:hypothetical protein
MDNDALKGSGPSFIGDLARMGGAAPLVYALVGTWPTGISVNSSTGAVSGTPTNAGTFNNLSVKVTDADSEVSQLPTFTLVVAAA